MLANKLPEMMEANEMAKQLRISERHFKDRISKRPDFPIAIKIGGSRQWIKSEFVFKTA